MAGFTKQQLESLDELFDRKFKQLEDLLLGRSAPPPTPAPSAPPPAPRLPPLPPTNPPTLAHANAPPPGADTLKEVEYKQADKSLRNIRKQPNEQKHRAAKAMPNPCDAEVFGNIIAWPPKFGGTNMRLSRDEHLDAWYTTMLNTRAKAQQI